MELTFHGYVLQVFPKGSHLVQDVSETILRMRESGKMQELEDFFIESSTCPSSSDDDKSHRLSLDSFLGLFVITIGTPTVALMLFFSHQLWNHWQMNMDMNFYFVSFIRQLHFLWNMYANVYWSIRALRMEAL